MKILIIFSVIMCGVAGATFIGLAQQKHPTELNQRTWEGKANTISSALAVTDPTPTAPIPDTGLRQQLAKITREMFTLDGQLESAEKESDSLMAEAHRIEQEMSALSLRSPEQVAGNYCEGITRKSDQMEALFKQMNQIGDPLTATHIKIIHIITQKAVLTGQYIKLARQSGIPDLLKVADELETSLIKLEKLTRT